MTEFPVSLPESSTGVCATLHSLVDSSTVQCEVTESVEGGGGRYLISVQPTSRGRHELTITSDGVAVEGSPVRILVYPPPQMMGRPVRVLEGVSRPAGVAVRENGELVVTEIEPAAVRVRDTQGELIRSFQQGSPKLDNPYGVAIDSEGCVYVADLIHCKVHKFSSDGAFLKSVGGGESDGNGHLAFPAGINISSNDSVYVCDDTNKKVYVFDKNLDFLFSFGERGDGQGQLQGPSDIAFDSGGNVFVADSERKRIMKFTQRGKFVSEFEMKGQSSEFELGICIGPRGQMFVSDFWSHRVVVFDTAGNFVTSFGRKGAEPGEFDMPAGIAVDSDGYVYVCDQLNSRLQVF